MRNLKKFLALVLAMMMTLSLMVTVNAATTSNKKFSDSESVTAAFEEDLLVVNGMGIIQGYEDGSFGPQRTITRGQMAAIVYRIATGDAEDKYVHNYVGYNTFTDVKDTDWFAGYIGYCANAGYIQGYGNGRFGPFNEVTGYQALAMILRAMGYNEPGHNFTGTGWETYTSSTATNRGMLVRVNSTNYRNSLRQPAHRELVAELAFQGLTKAQVQYTPAYGYQTTGMTGGLLSGNENPSLGLANYGLTNHKGIVVGNQYTGETATKIGFSLDVALDNGLQIGDNNGTFAPGTTGWTVTGNLTAAGINDDVSKAAYYYNSALVRTDGVAPNPVNEYNVTLSFKWDSDLSLFNHAVDVWYDCRGTTTNTVTFDKTGGANANVNGSVTFQDNLDTYAVFDRVVKAQVVAAPGAGTLNDTPTNNSVTDNLTEAVLDAGFARRTGTDVNKAFFNYAFARNTSNNWADTASTANYSGPSPIKPNNGVIGNNGEGMAEANAWPLYLVISNTQGNVVDVVVPLDLTLSKVAQDNNTQAPLSTGVVTRNNQTDATGNEYFDTWDALKINAGDTANYYSNVANKNRVDSYDAKLGDYVAAIAITGTNEQPVGYKTGVTTTAATATDGNAKAAGDVGAGTGNTGGTTAPMTSTYWYQFKQLTNSKTKSMLKFDRDTQKVYFTDGTEAERSVFALAVDGAFQPHTHVMAPTAAGEYTFYFDAEGKWLFWEQAAKTSTFVYGTYLDFETIPASSSFNYPMVYTDDLGTEKLMENITKVDGVDMNNAQYGHSMLPKRTTVGDNSSGFTAGQYIGYAMLDGVLTSITPTNDQRTGFFQAGSTHNTAVDGWNDFGYTGTTTVIDADSLAIGAEPVGGSGNLFLTSRTKFIIVDGAGTDNQKVTVCEGLADFLGNYKSVTIDAATAPVANPGKYINTGKNAFNTAPADDYAGQVAPWNMVYYSLEQDPYSQDYNMMDKYIDTVFIPAPLVSTSAKVDGNLYFVGDSGYGLIDADNNATQFTFYKNEEKSVMWITGLPTDVNSDAEIIDTLNDNVFYQLAATDKKAVDGNVIYRLIPFESKAAADKVIIGQYYGDDDLNTGDITAATGKTTVFADNHASQGYLATTRNSQVAYVGGRTSAFLRNITSADVLNLNKDFTINSIGDLNDQSALTTNQGVSVSCVLGENALITFIYVNV